MAQLSSGKLDGRKAPVSSFTEAASNSLTEGSRETRSSATLPRHANPSLDVGQVGIAPAMAHLPSHDCVGPGYIAMETWHSPLAMWPSLLVVMIQDPLPSAHSLSLRAVFNT